MENNISKSNIAKNDDRLVVIHQPDFLPYLGFFHRLKLADLYVVFDNVQYVRSSRGWTSRDKIKTASGEKWITVGTKKAPRDTIIYDVLLNEEQNWRDQHLNLFRENYKKSKYFDEVFPYLEKLYSFKCERMMDFNLESIKMLMELLDVHCDMVLASDLNTQGKSNNLIVDVMHKVGATRYLSGVGAEDYYDPEVYKAGGIEVIWQDFEHPVYPQQYGEFIPYLSSIDLLLNCGIEESRKIAAQW